MAHQENDSQNGASAGTAAADSMDKNIILFGVPGTGKTYSVVQYAVSIIEKKSLDDIKKEGYDEVFARYRKYKDEGLIVFTTFHQSFGYEEFIEGIRPVLTEDGAGHEIKYELRDGVFKAFCDKANTLVRSVACDDLRIRNNAVVWKVSLEGTGENQTRTECMKNNHIRIGWDEYGETIPDSIDDYSKYGGSVALNAFYNRMKIGDIVFSCYSSKTIDAIGVVTGQPEWCSNEYKKYKRRRKVNWLAKGLDKDISHLNDVNFMSATTVYRLTISDFQAIEILREINPSLFSQVSKKKHVFIIDEINRGNISKIFGELITLIEPSKRIGAKEELHVELPYSGKKFGVPSNVYIVGTMNTADRSIALIDTALRRRFTFVEMLPDSSVLKEVRVDDLDISKMLDTLNKRITALLDREHTIGHSYFLPLKGDPSMERLAEIFKGKIIPLLQEYFHDDYEKIRLVLGDNQKKDDRSRFIIKKDDIKNLFGNTSIDSSDYYEINSEAFKRIEAYAYMRQTIHDN